MDNITIPYNFTPRDYQLGLFEALDSGCNRAFLRWCRRAGKDKTCFNYLVKRAFQQVGLYYYFFPTYQQGRKALWEAIQDGEKLLDHIPPGTAKFNNNELKIQLSNGSLIRVIGTNDYDSIMGTNPIGIIFSEYALQDPNAWDYIQPILAQNKGWVIFNSTPRGKNHMYDLESKITGQKGWYVSVIQTLWPDLPNYYPVASQEEIQNARIAGMSEEKIESEFGVSYVAGQQGAYYADCIVAARQTNRIGNFPHNDHLWVDTFWDLGKNDSTSIWFRQTDGNALVWIDYYEDSNKSPNHYAQILQEKGYNYRTHWMPHDAAHDRLEGCLKNIFQQLFSSAGICDDIMIADRPPQKMIAINAVRSRFSRYYFNESTTGDGLIKLSLYHRKFDDKNRVFMETPVHDWTSHCADAITTEALTANMNDVKLGGTGNAEPVTNFDPFGD